MPDAITINETMRSDALAAYNLGWPSTLSDENPFKRHVVAHRYGHHYDSPVHNCPACSAPRLSERQLCA